MLRVTGDLSRHRARSTRDTSSSCTNFGCCGNRCRICHCGHTYLCQHWSSQNCSQRSTNCRSESVVWISGWWSNRLPIRGVVDYLEGRTTLPAIRVRELVWISVRVPIPIELPRRLFKHSHRVHGQEHPQLRIHVPLLHVVETGSGITHVSGIARTVGQIFPDNIAVRLVRHPLYDVAIGIRLGHDRSECIGMQVADRCLRRSWCKPGQSG